MSEVARQDENPLVSSTSPAWTGREPNVENRRKTDSSEDSNRGLSDEDVEEANLPLESFRNNMTVVSM